MCYPEGKFHGYLKESFKVWRWPVENKFSNIWGFLFTLQRVPVKNGGASSTPFPNQVPEFHFELLLSSLAFVKVLWESALATCSAPFPHLSLPFP